MSAQNINFYYLFSFRIERLQISKRQTHTHSQQHLIPLTLNEQHEAQKKRKKNKIQNEIQDKIKIFFVCFTFHRLDWTKQKEKTGKQNSKTKSGWKCKKRVVKWNATARVCWYDSTDSRNEIFEFGFVLLCRHRQRRHHYHCVHVCVCVCLLCCAVDAVCVYFTYQIVCDAAATATFD